MGVLLDILTSKYFRQRPAMYIGTSEFVRLSWWIRGFEEGCHRALPEQAYELDGFREWLHMQLDGPGNTDWVGIIEWKFGNGVEATQKVFDYLDQFLQDVSHLGKDKIITDHAEYETRRYGFLSSSRLAKGNQKE